MAKKTDARSLVRKQLGRDLADIVLKRADILAKKNAPPSEIEQAIAEDVSKAIQKLGRAVRGIIPGIFPKA